MFRNFNRCSTACFPFYNGAISQDRFLGVNMATVTPIHIDFMIEDSEMETLPSSKAGSGKHSWCRCYDAECVKASEDRCRSEGEIQCQQEPGGSVINIAPDSQTITI